MQIDRVRRGPAAPDREGVPGQGALQLAQDGVGRARRGRVVGARQEDHDLGAHGVRTRGEHGGSAGEHGARAAIGHAEHALAPAVLGRHERVGARDDDARPLDQVDPQLARPAEDVLAAGDVAVEQGVQEAGQRLLGGALGRAQALDLGGDQRRHELDQRGAGLAPRAHPQRAHRRIGHPQLDRLDPGRVVEQRALVGRRTRRHGQHRPRAVGQHEAGVERPSGGADDLGQAGARLDGVGDRVQRSEIEPGRRSVGRGGHAPILRRSPC